MDPVVTQPDPTDGQEAAAHPRAEPETGCAFGREVQAVDQAVVPEPIGHGQLVGAEREAVTGLQSIAPDMERLVRPDRPAERDPGRPDMCHPEVPAGGVM